MATTHGNYGPPCGLILHEVFKCSSEAELHLNGAESRILKLGGKLASPVLDKTFSQSSSTGQRGLSCPLPCALTLRFVTPNSCTI